MTLNDLDRKPHGTAAAYRRHYRTGTRPCRECKQWRARWWVDMGYSLQVARRAVRLPGSPHTLETCGLCAMSNPLREPPVNPDEPTTLQISKGQRFEIEDIRADLVVAGGRHVSTKETLSAIIDYWKENHPRESR